MTDRRKYIARIKGTFEQAQWSALSPRQDHLIETTLLLVETEQLKVLAEACEREMRGPICRIPTTEELSK